MLLLSPLIAFSAIATSTGTSAPREFIASVQAWSFHVYTAFEAIEMTAHASGKYIELFPGQPLKPGSAVKVGPDMGEDATQELKAELNKNGVTPVAFGVVGIPKDPEQARPLFRWAKSLGLLVIDTESVDSIDTMDLMVKEFDIKIGFHDHPKRANDPSYKMWDPNYVLSVVKDHDRRIGSCADIGHWVRSGVRPIDALRILKGRIVDSHMKDLNEFSPNGHDVPFGLGVSDIAAVLDEFKRQGFMGPASVEFEYNDEHDLPEVAACLGFMRGYLHEKH